MPIAALAAEVTSASANTVVSGVQQVVDAATANFNFGTIASILGVAIAGAAGLYLLWWGSRKGLRMLKNAFSKGKLSI